MLKPLNLDFSDDPHTHIHHTGLPIIEMECLWTNSDWPHPVFLRMAWDWTRLTLFKGTPSYYTKEKQPKNQANLGMETWSARRGALFWFLLEDPLSVWANDFRINCKPIHQREGCFIFCIHNAIYNCVHSKIVIFEIIIQNSNMFTMLYKYTHVHQ